MEMKTAIGLVGGGQMGEALVRGMLAGGLTTAEMIMVADPDPARTSYLQAEYHVRVSDDLTTLCRQCATLILAVKPQVIDTVAGELGPHLGGGHLLVSIMAGVTLESLARHLGEQLRIIRVMPNTPSLVLAGAAAFAGNERATQEDRDTVRSIFGAVGTCVDVPERLLDAVTGLSGSGPGYVFTFIEAMIDGGVLAGIPRPVAEQLVLQTVYGSAKLALATREPAAVLKGKVTSPGGTTIAGIHVLEERGLRGTVMAAVVAATERSKELGT